MEELSKLIEQGSAPLFDAPPVLFTPPSNQGTFVFIESNRFERWPFLKTLYKNVLHSDTVKSIKDFQKSILLRDN